MREQRKKGGEKKDYNFIFMHGGKAKLQQSLPYRRVRSSPLMPNLCKEAKNRCNSQVHRISLLPFSYSLFPTLKLTECHLYVFNQNLSTSQDLNRRLW